MPGPESGEKASAGAMMRRTDRGGRKTFILHGREGPRVWLAGLALTGSTLQAGTRCLKLVTGGFARECWRVCSGR